MTTENQKQTPPRGRNLMYTQRLDSLPRGSADALESLVKRDLRPENYVVVIHDREVGKNGQPKKPHVHVFMSFKNARSVNAIAKKLGDKPQYVTILWGDVIDVYAYLFHPTESDMEEDRH